MARYTEKFRNKVLTAVNSGLAPSVAAKRFKISAGTVSTWLSNYNSNNTSNSSDRTSPRARLARNSNDSVMNETPEQRVRSLIQENDRLSDEINSLHTTIGQLYHKYGHNI